MKAIAFGCIAGLLALSVSTPAAAQESRSAPLAKQLADALDASKMDSVAARDPSAPDVFFGALYLPGVQLLVVSAKYSAPQLLAERIAKKEYRDVYVDLNSASVPDTKIFIEDLGANGLQIEHESSRAADSYDVGGKRTQFNNEWKAQKISEQDYKKTCTAADEKYAQILTALLAQLRKTS